jgi:tetratricopeptide (TPR) repeat protein
MICPCHYARSPAGVEPQGGLTMTFDSLPTACFSRALAPTLLLGLALLACSPASSGLGARQRAALLADRDQLAEATRVLRDELADHPHDIETRRLLVRVVALTGDLGAVRREVERLRVELGPQNPIVWVELGHALELSHRYDEALAMYDRAADVAPSDPLGPLTGGLRAARWGEWELAEPRLSEALRRDPSRPEAWHALGLARLTRRDFAGAERAYGSGLQADPKALQNRLGLATVAVARGDPASALRHYDLLIASRPRFGDAHLGRSWALIGLGRLEDARKALDRAAELGADARALSRQRAFVQRLSRSRPTTHQRQRRGVGEPPTPQDGGAAPPSEVPPAATRSQHEGVGVGAPGESPERGASD